MFGNNDEQQAHLVPVIGGADRNVAARDANAVTFAEGEDRFADRDLAMPAEHEQGSLEVRVVLDRPGVDGVDVNGIRVRRVVGAKADAILTAWRDVLDRLVDGFV